MHMIFFEAVKSMVTPRIAAEYYRLNFRWKWQTTHRRCDLGFAGDEKTKIFSRQMKTVKILSQERTIFTELCFSEPSIGIMKKCVSARVYEITQSSVKQAMSTCVHDITPPNLSGFAINRIFCHTAKSVCRIMHRLRCFHHLKSWGKIGEIAIVKKQFQETK